MVQGFDFQTGERLWSNEIIGEGKVPSTVIGEGLVFTASGWGGKESIRAFRLGNSFSGARNRCVQNFLIHTKAQPAGTVTILVAMG